MTDGEKKRKRFKQNLSLTDPGSGVINKYCIDYQGYVGCLMKERINTCTQTGTRKTVRKQWLAMKFELKKIS